MTDFSINDWRKKHVLNEAIGGVVSRKAFAAMPGMFRTEAIDHIDDKEAATDYSDLEDKDLDNDGSTGSAEDKYLHKTLKTSLDYPEDYEFIKHVFSELYRQDTVFSILEIIDLVKRRPDILNINANAELTRRWRQHQQRLQKGFVKQ